MLHEKIQSTIGLIDDVVDNRQKENDNANAAKRNTIFFDSFAKLAPSITSYVLVKKSFGFTLQSAMAEDLKEIMDYSKVSFDNAKAVNPSNFKKSVEAFIDMISKEWEMFYKANNSELINGLNIIALVYPNPSVVRGSIAAINKCEKWPLTQEVVDSYMKAKQKADDLLKEMKFDDEIKDFLVKVRDRKATLTDITPSILEWIQSENIADKVSLSIRNYMQ